MSGRKRIEDLNSIPVSEPIHYRTGHTDFHFRKGIKIEGKEGDTRECKECHKILPLTAFNTHTMRSNGAFTLRNKCKNCGRRLTEEQTAVKKNAPPKPDFCNCCHGKEFLQRDHLHGTFIFRGYLCRNCNTGIGGLGDTLEGVLQAAVYLENNKNKIIEKLHKVYDEMFARTNE